MPKFIVQFQGQESVAELKPGANSIGRQSTNAIPLKDSTLSRLHCEVILAGTVATLLDKGSRNGTLLNGKKVDAQVLQPGDKVQIGATVLWYEKKNIAAEKPPAPKAAPAAEAAAPPTPAPVPATRRATTGDARPGTAAVRPGPAAVVPATLQDYAIHGKAGGHAGKIIAALLVVVLLGVAGTYIRRFLDRPVLVDVDLENLITRNAHFEGAPGSKVEGWAMRASLTGDKSSATASIDAAHGRNGGSCLLLDKAPGASDLVAECGYSEDLNLPRGGVVSASAWTQFENFGGSAAIKIDWLRSARGAVIAEEISDLVKAAAWTELKATFTPPAGAGAFRFGLAIVGRSGRVYFDDVNVKLQPGAAAGPEQKIGQHHKAAWTKAGVLQLDLGGGRRTLTNISVRLESEKEGATPQACASDVVAAPEESGVTFKCRLVNPLDFREVPFEERVGQVAGFTTVEFAFPGEALKQVDRVSIVLTLPRVDGPPRGLSESGDPVSRIVCGAEGGDFALEYSEPARVKYRTVDGRMRITQTWNVDIDNPVFVFRIRDSGERGPDPQEEIVKLSKLGKLGESLALERDEVKKVREAVVRERMETDIRNLEVQERREWVEAQALAFQARISRRSQLSADALKALDAYLKRWAGEGTEGKADTLRRDLEKELAQTPPAEAERPRRIFERAKKLAEGGRRALAQSLLQTLVVRYPSSDVASDAQTLLKSLSD